MALQTSLVDIWNSRPDLQAAFPRGLQRGTSDNSNLNNWWNTNGKNEYPNVTLVAPGTTGIQNPSTITRESQAGQSPVASAYQSAGQAPETPPKLSTNQPSSGQPISMDRRLQILQALGLSGKNFENSDIANNTTDEQSFIKAATAFGLRGGYFEQNEVAGRIARIPQVSQNTTQNSTQSNNVGGVDTSGLPANIQGVLDQIFKNYLTPLLNSGARINPNITIGPNEIAQFAAAAHAQLDPYYQDQLAGATTSFLQQTGNDVNQFNQLISNTQTQYGRSLENLGAQSAEQGFAQSGIRGKQEGQLAQDTQTNIDQARRQLMFQEQGAAQAFAGQYGGANVPFGGFAPSNTRVLPGQSQFQNTGSNLPLYNLSDSVYSRIIGTQQNEQQTAEQNLTGQLASNAQQYGVNQSLRMLSL